MPRLKNGMARVEFLTVCAEVEALLGKGHPCSSIYERFKADGKISMSYRTFYHYASQVCPSLKRGKKLLPAAQPSTAPPPASAPSVPRDDAAASPDVSGQTKVPAGNGPIVVGDKQSSKFGKDKSDPDALM